jgi:hypothetical protein
MAGVKGVFVATALVAGMLVALPAHAQSWRPIERQCAHEINQVTGAGAPSAGSWPLWTECTVQRAYGNQIDPTRLKDCMQRIWDRRLEQRTCAVCGDPVAESIKCAGGE